MAVDERRGRAAADEPEPQPQSSGGTGPAPIRRGKASRLPGSSVHASIANEIGLRIVRGDYPPGAILPNEARWAKMFDVSRSAVREAIKMLMAKGLLNSRPKVGSWVEPRERWNLLDRDVLTWYAMSPDREKFLKTVQEFRYLIEPEAAAFAARRRSEEQMAEISAACREMGEARSLPERTEADTRFHLAILRASGNELLVPLGVLIESAFDQLFIFVTREQNDLAHAQTLHENIEKCIRLKRPEAARAAVRKLLANTDDIIAGVSGRPPRQAGVVKRPSPDQS
ncbi:GntR family transcriptional regulator [Mesorhizobium sp. L-8-10]|uniref:FadR/GntR family transcriptional regulator n=1 Tax=unclassified Mesorhizobium TaxID=325217 RepID=UPI001928B050|nr:MULTISPECIES: FadR/GntR family transcriptional regulator [unclassified Mesorhizobium]BCH26397.1 GntR family transcriptional regulator [Mesorhizobium sp. L-8-3]BCH34383.1 GntR family transcriptional regulator [Mesorhizobium sp. L-8-10]